MSVEPYIKVLRDRHSALEAEIEEEENRPHPDEVVIQNLKKQKLLLKDQIEQVTRS